MENQLPTSPQSLGASSKQKLSKIFLILFSLIFLVLIAEGIYYFYSQKFEVPGIFPEIFQKKQSDTKSQINAPTFLEGSSSSHQDLIEKYPISAHEGISHIDDKSFNLLGKVAGINTTEKKIMVKIYGDVLAVYYSDASQTMMAKETGIEFEKFLPEKIREGDLISFGVSRDQDGKFILKSQTQ